MEANISFTTGTRAQRSSRWPQAMVLLAHMLLGAMPAASQNPIASMVVGSGVAAANRELRRFPLPPGLIASES